MRELEQIAALTIAPIPSDFATKGESYGSRVSDWGLSLPHCNGFWYDIALIVPSLLFIVFLAFQARKSFRKLSHGRSYIIVAYYGLLWLVSVLNLTWCALQRKRNPQASDPPVDNLKNPRFLVLISENFMEARSALSRSGIAVLGPNQVPLKVDTSSFPPVSGPPVTSIPSVNGSMVNRQSVPGVNIPTATVKLEPTTVTSMGPAAYPHLPSVSHGKSQGAPTLQTSSPSSTSQDVIANGDNAQEFKPMVNGTSQPLRPVGPAAANVSILNNLSQARQVMSSASLTGPTSMGLQTMGGNPMAMHMSNMISSGMSSSALPAAPNVYSSGQSGMTSVTGSAALVGNAQVAQNAPHGSFSSATSNMTGNSNLSTSQPLANLQGSASMGQSVPVMSQGNHSVTQMGQNGIGMNQNMMNGLGASNVTAGGGTMIPTPGMSQQVQSGSLPQGSQQAKYLKVWEGALYGQRLGQPVFTTRLEGYRNASASDTLAAD